MIDYYIANFKNSNFTDMKAEIVNHSVVNIIDDLMSIYYGDTLPLHKVEELLMEVKMLEPSYVVSMCKSTMSNIQNLTSNTNIPGKPLSKEITEAIRIMRQIQKLSELGNYVTWVIDCDDMLL